MSAHVFDLHDEAHAISRDHGIRGATLVHWEGHAALAALYRRTCEARLAHVHEVMAGAALGAQPSGVIRSPAENTDKHQ